MSQPDILLTGATGYVGGRLLGPLVARGHHVRCLARTPEKLADLAAERVEVTRGDLLDPGSLDHAFEGCEAAFYLVHSMGDEGSFTDMEKRAAENFAAAARRAGVKRIVYLGGLGDDEADSDHLESRHVVGEILRASGIVTIELRAAVVIGEGSLSFEMIRSLVERLPVMVTPRWVRVRTQPIAIADVVAYLLASLDLETDTSEIFEIGGPDRVAYMDMMVEYGRQRGLRRLMIPVPVLTPYLSSLWLGLVTPVYAKVGRALVESIKHETVVTDERALRVFPDIEPMGLSDAIARALEGTELSLQKAPA